MADPSIEDLVADGSEQAFIRLVERVQGRESAPADVEAWHTARADRNAGPALAALFESSRAREIDAYALEAPPPGDFRSRLMVQDVLASLGTSRHEPSFAVLVDIWKRHPVRELRVYAAHGLLGWGEWRSLEALSARVDEVRAVELTLAVRAAFRLGSASVFDRLALARRIDAGGDAVAAACLHHLLRTPDDAMDPRWIGAAVNLTRRGSGASPDLRRLARDWLATMPREQVTAAKKRPPQPVAPPLDPAVREAALARARARIEPLARRIAALAPLAPEAPEAIDRLEHRLGFLPAVVRAWYERIGGVDLTAHAEPPESALVVVPLAQLIDDAADEPDVGDQAPDEVVPFVFRLVPEPATLAGYSAGPGYGVRAGAPGEAPEDDPVLVDHPDGLTFMDHVESKLGRSGAEAGDQGGAGDGG